MDVVFRYNINCFVIEFVFEYYEYDFLYWVESCLILMEYCVRDLELLYVKGVDSEIKYIENVVVVFKLVGENFVWVFRMKDIDGVFFLGNVDCMINLI